MITKCSVCGKKNQIQEPFRSDGHYTCGGCKALLHLGEAPDVVDGEFVPAHPAAAEPPPLPPPLPSPLIDAGIIKHVPWIMSILLLVTAGLCVGALARNPYGYYQLLRWTVFLVCGYTAIVAFGSNAPLVSAGFAVMAFLFNPLLPFHLSRNTWQTFDQLGSAWCIIAGTYISTKIAIIRKREEINRSLKEPVK